VLVAALAVLAGGGARAFDSHCGVGAVECPDGLAAARIRWGVDGATVDERSEHARLWLETFAVSGLPASLNETIELPVFTTDEVIELKPLPTDTVPDPRLYPTVRPVFAGALRRQLRVTSLAELTQLPDFSYTLWDWAAGNESCPPGPLNPEVCHEYFPHIGMLNSNHMVPQAERFYAHYHRLGLARAGECFALFDRLPAEHRERFEPFVLECEKEALVLEAVGQHFLQDAWSMGHMWERWGGPEFVDFGPGPFGDRTLGAAIAAYTGIIHGARAMLGAGFDDPLCAPHPGVTYIDGAPAAPTEQLGLGDVFLDEVLLPAADGSAYAPQRRALFGCAVDGMRTVYERTAQLHGAMLAPTAAAIDGSRRVTDASCWGQRATNQALAIGFGLHAGMQPNQQPLLEVYPGLADAGTENEVFPAGILAFAFSTFAPAVGLPQFSDEQAQRFARDAAAAATEAAAKGADPETALATDLASGGLPPIAGIRPNSHYAQGSEIQPPSSYADPFLPWTLSEVDPEVQEREQALNLTFADAHAADRCGEMDEFDLLQYRALAAEAVGGDVLVEEARCGQCELMVAPHLRFGQPGNHDARREALCALVGVPNPTFVYTEEDPSSFTGGEPTDLASIRAATRAWCGCGKAPPVLAATSSALGASVRLKNLPLEPDIVASDGSLGFADVETVTAALPPTTVRVGDVFYTGSGTSTTTRTIARLADAVRVALESRRSVSLSVSPNFAGFTQISGSSGDVWCAPLPAGTDLEYSSDPPALSIFNRDTGDVVVTSATPSGRVTLGSGGTWCVQYGAENLVFYDPNFETIEGEPAAESRYSITLRGGR
jgi:hypothetical protein